MNAVGTRQPPTGAPTAVGGPPESERLHLAQLAVRAALRIPGVMRTDTGRLGTFVAAGGGRRVEGVICAAAPEGGYEVALQLVCGVVSLPEVGRQVRRAVAISAAAAGIAVADVSVHVSDVAAPGT